jgi:RHS repeat-associated protein
MQARDYRPDTGRFLTEDRFEQAGVDLELQADPLTQNRYAFAGGNPVSAIEFDGHFGCRRGDPCQNRARAEGAHVAPAPIPPPSASPQQVQAAASAVAQQKTEQSQPAGGFSIPGLVSSGAQAADSAGSTVGSSAADVATGSGQAFRDFGVGVFNTASSVTSSCAGNANPLACIAGETTMDTVKSTVKSISDLPHICDGRNAGQCAGYLGTIIAGAVATRKVGGEVVAGAEEATEIRTGNLVHQKFPANEGFFMGWSRGETLKPGLRIDRYGSEGGRFFSPQGTPFERRGLPPSARQAGPRGYEVLRDLPVRAGLIEPVFGPGMGIQYKSAYSAAELVQRGYLGELP